MGMDDDDDDDDDEFIVGLKGDGSMERKCVFV